MTRLASQTVAAIRSLQTRRSLFCLLSLLGVVGIILSVFLQDLDSIITSDVFQPTESMRKYVLQSLSTSCPASCASDPFSRPGMIHWDPNGLANETRWLPFGDSGADGEVASGQRIADAVPRMDQVPAHAFEDAAPQYMARLEADAGVGNDPDWDWLRNRTLLFIDDRNNVDQFCQIAHGKYTSWGGHLGGFCEVSGLNLVVINFFLFGMVDQDDLGFPPNDDPPFTFEGRIEQLLLPLTEKHAVARTPDLVILSSLFWDESFLSEYGRNHRDRRAARGFLWYEISWHRSRVRDLFTFVRSKYGPNIPMMFRTRHIRANTQADRLLHVAQLDQSGRAASRDMGVRLFTWGEKLEGYVQYYDQDQHFKLGPNTFLFGDMALFYLRQATIPGCWACRTEHF